MKSIISIKGFEPKTAKPGEEVKRKIELRDLIFSQTKNLNDIKETFRGKFLSLNVRFFLYNGNIKDTTRYTKDLDNLLKIVCDVLPDYMDTDKINAGLGIIEQKRDDLIYEIHCAKEFVSTTDEEGIEIELSEYYE